MTPRRLRLRVLTILGLPALACTKSAPAPDNAEPPVLEIPTIASASASSAANEDQLDEELFTHPAARAFDCGPDRTRAFVCGSSYGVPKKPAQRPYDKCDATASSVSHEVALGRSGTPAPFDSALTARFRDHKKGDDKACCYSRCVDVKSMAAAAKLPKGYRSRLECITNMRRGSQHPADGRSDCPAAVDFGGGPDRKYAAPFNEESSKLRTEWARERTGFQDLSLCCYQDAMRYSPHIRRGRALRDAAGDILAASSRPSTAWVQQRDLGAETSQDIAARWLRDAELEHASVASFAQLALALMACGAPPELIAAAHESALDEIRHAEICYGLASQYAGEALGPGPLSPPPMPRADVVALALETFRDGCVGETAAALVASRSAAACAVPEVTVALEEIASDEERHALLAWRILAWTMSFEGVRDALADACDRLAAEAPPLEEEPDTRAAHGLLSAATEMQIRHEVVREVVLPCARALLEA